MLNIEIDNPELEENLKQLFGNNQQSIASDFAEFMQQRKIKQNLGVLLTLAIQSIRNKILLTEV